MTKTLPFGAPGERRGVHGLLTGLPNLTVGDSVEGRIDALDPLRQRFGLTGR